MSPSSQPIGLCGWCEATIAPKTAKDVSMSASSTTTAGPSPPPLAPGGTVGSMMASTTRPSARAAVTAQPIQAAAVDVRVRPGAILALIARIVSVAAWYRH